MCWTCIKYLSWTIFKFFNNLVSCWFRVHKYVKSTELQGIPYFCGNAVFNYYIVYIAEIL